MSSETDKPEHDEIFLIDLGDGDLAWCDEQFPSDDIYETDSVGYTKTSLIDDKKEKLIERVQNSYSEVFSAHPSGTIELIPVDDVLKIINEVFK